MSSTPNFDCWGLVIDTDMYAGNFERELCAHITGKVGDCGVGKEYVETSEDGVDEDDEENDLFFNVICVPDDNGCYRPCSIYPNPNWKNNGFGFHYQAGQETLAMEKLIDSYKKQADDMLRIYRHNSAHANLERDAWLKKAAAIDSAPDYPAYFSVVIYFEDEPTTEQIRVVKERANTFKPNDSMGFFKIERFRLVRFKMTADIKDI